MRFCFIEFRGIIRVRVGCFGDWNVRYGDLGLGLTGHGFDGVSVSLGARGLECTDARDPLSVALRPVRYRCLTVLFLVGIGELGLQG